MPKTKNNKIQNIDKRLKKLETQRNIKYYIIPIILIIISSLALYGAYREVIFPFSLDIYVDGYFLPHTSTLEDYSNSFPLGIPIIFVNKGYGMGIVEDATLTVTNKKTNNISLYTPIVEIDFYKYLAEKRVLHAENIISPFFYPFILSGKEQIIKTYIFTQDTNNENYPHIPTLVGEYNIKLYLKVSNENYKEYFNFDFNFTKENMDDYNSGISIYKGRINLPSFEIE